MHPSGRLKSGPALLGETAKKKAPVDGDHTGQRFLKLTNMVGNKAAFDKPVPHEIGLIWFTEIKRKVAGGGGGAQ